MKSWRTLPYTETPSLQPPSSAFAFPDYSNPVYRIHLLLPICVYSRSFAANSLRLGEVLLQAGIEGAVNRIVAVVGLHVLWNGGAMLHHLDGGAAGLRR